MSNPFSVNTLLWQILCIYHHWHGLQGFTLPFNPQLKLAWNQICEVLYCWVMLLNPPPLFRLMQPVPLLLKNSWNVIDESLPWVVSDYNNGGIEGLRSVLLGWWRGVVFELFKVLYQTLEWGLLIYSLKISYLCFCPLTFNYVSNSSSIVIENCAFCTVQTILFFSCGWFVLPPANIIR